MEASKQGPKFIADKIRGCSIARYSKQEARVTEGAVLNCVGWIDSG